MGPDPFALLDRPRGVSDPFSLLDEDEEERKRRRANRTELASLASGALPDRPASLPVARDAGGRSSRLLFGQATPDINVSAPAPAPSLFTGIRRAQQVDIGAGKSPQARAERDRALSDRLRTLDTSKRLFTDVTAVPAQGALGAIRNIVSKGQALPDKAGGDLFRSATGELDELTGQFLDESGAIPGSRAAQVGANVIGGIGSELALFRGSGKLVEGVAGALGKTALPGASLAARIAALSRLANQTRGAKGVARRVARDATSFLPINLLNASDRDISAAGGFSDLGQQFGGNVEEGLTRRFEEIANDPARRLAFELGLDVVAGGIVESALSAARGLRGSAKGSREATSQIGNAFTEASARRRGEGLDGFDDDLTTLRTALDDVPGGAADLGLDTPPAAAVAGTEPVLPPEVPPAAVGRVQAPRRQMVDGRPTLLRFSDNTKITGRYALVELEDLIPSHDPFSYQPRPEFPPNVQGRDYARDLTSQQVNQQRAAELDADALLDPSFSPEKGPPTVTRQGIVISGNDRTMATVRASQQFPDRVATYRAALTELAPTYGLEPSAVESMRQPMLVRVVDDADGLDTADPDTLARLNQVSDASDTKAKEALDAGRGKAQAMRQARGAMAHLESTMPPDISLPEYLSSAAGRVFVTKLVEDGVFTAAELPRLIDGKTGTLNSAGRDLVKSIMMTAGIDDVGALSRAPASIIGKMEQAFVPLARSRGGPYDLSTEVGQALDVLAQARARGVPVSGVLDQTGLGFTGPPIPARAAVLARLLESGNKKQVTDTFRAWAQLADEARVRGTNEDIFGGADIESVDESFARLFGSESGRQAVLGDPAPVNLFDDVNVGRTGQQEFFDEGALAAPESAGTPPTPAGAGGPPALPGKITAEELIARPELRGQGRPVPGADDPRQALLLDPAGTPRPVEAQPASSVLRTEPVEFKFEVDGSPVGSINVAAGTKLADELNVRTPARAEAPRSRTSRGPKDPTPLADETGAIPSRSLSGRELTEIGTSVAGGLVGASQGEGTTERIQLGAAGFVAGLGGARLGSRAVQMAVGRRAALKTPRIKSMQRMVQILAEGFDVPTRSGKRWWAEVSAQEKATTLGYFDPNVGARMVRLEHTAQLSTMIHEIGHVLKDDFTAAVQAGNPQGLPWIAQLDENTLTELYALGKALYGLGHSERLYVEEGFAEWVRRYTSGQSMDQVPNASRLLNQMLDANPRWRQTIETVKEQMAQHIAGTPEERALAMLAGESRGVRQGRSRARDWLDRTFDSREAVKSLGIVPDVQRGKVFKSNSNALLRMSASANGAAEYALKNGVSDPRTGQFVTKPLMQVFEALTVDEIKEFETYLLAEATLERGVDRVVTRTVGVAKDGTPITRDIRLKAQDTGLDVADAESIVATHRAKYEPLGERIWEHQHTMLDLKVAGGVLSASEAAWMKKVHTKHIPLYREFYAQTELPRNIANNKITQSGNTIFRAKGSKRDIIHPLLSIIGDTYSTYNVTARHKAGLQLLREARQAPDGARVLKVLKRPPLERVTFGARTAIKQLEDLGYPIADVKAARRRIRDATKAGETPQAADEELVELYRGLADQQLTEFRTIRSPTAADRTQLVMPMIEDGHRVWTQFADVNLYEAFNGLNTRSPSIEDIAGAGGGLLRKMTSLLRQSAVLTAAFIKRNAIRDMFPAFRRTNSNRLVLPGEHLVRGIGIMLNHYAESVPTPGLRPPPGRERVLWQIGGLLNESAKATLRTQVGTAAVGGAIGASTADTPEGRVPAALLGAGALLGAKRLGGKVELPGGAGFDDVFDLWMRHGGGGVTLAGVDINSHEQTLKELSRTPLQKRIVILHPIEMLRTLSSLSEMTNRLGEVQIIMRQQLAMGASISDARLAGLRSAAELTQDFTKGGRLGMAWNQISPFANANIIGKVDLARDMTNPRRFTRMITSVTIPTLVLWALQRDDPEYQDAPQHEKDGGWVLIWPPKQVRDLAAMLRDNPDQMDWLPSKSRAWLELMADEPVQRIVGPKPFDSGVIFGTIPERIFESTTRALDDDPTTDPAQAGGFTYNLTELLFDLVNPFSLPPPLQVAADLATNEDFADRTIVPAFTEGAKAENRATNRTGETSRTLAKASRLLAEPLGGKGVPAAAIEQVFTGTLGPLGAVPVGISDAVIRRIREEAGLPLLRPEPQEGFTVAPGSFSRAFVRGERTGGGAAVTQFFELLPQAKSRWSEFINATTDEEEDELSEDPLVQLYAPGVGAIRLAERRIERLRARRKLALEARDDAAAREAEQEITEIAREMMKEVGRARDRARKQ